MYRIGDPDPAFQIPNAYLLKIAALLQALLALFALLVKAAEPFSLVITALLICVYLYFTWTSGSTRFTAIFWLIVTWKALLAVGMVGELFSIPSNFARGEVKAYWITQLLIRVSQSVATPYLYRKFQMMHSQEPTRPMTNPEGRNSLFPGQGVLIQ